MARLLAAAVMMAVGAGPAAAGVLVFANYTPADVTITLKEAGGAPRTVRLTPYQTLPVRVDGPVDATYQTRDKTDTLHLEPNNAYAIVPDEKHGRRIEGIGLPGRAPESDAKPEGKPPSAGTSTPACASAGSSRPTTATTSPTRW